MFKSLKRKLTRHNTPWWKNLWLSRMKEFFDREVFHEAQTRVRSQSPGVRIEGAAYKCRFRVNDQIYQMRVEPLAFEEASWQPILDEIARHPQLIQEFQGNGGHDLESVFKKHGGEMLIDRALEAVPCKCGTPRCVHRAMALLAIEDIISESVMNFWHFCGCGPAYLIDQMYKRGIDSKGRRGGPEVLAWQERQRAMLNDFWGGTDELQLQEITKLRAEVPRLPLEMEIFMSNVRRMISSAHTTTKSKPSD